MTRREFIRFTALAGLKATVIGGGISGYMAAVEPNWIDIEQVKLKLPRLAAAFDGYRIVQLSDIHLGDWLDGDRLGQVVAMANAQGANLIAVTGDFITNTPDRSTQTLVEKLSALRAPDGVVGVLGNHDHWHGPDKIREVMRRSGIVELDNRVFPLRRGNDNFFVAGVDDVYTAADRLDLVLDSLPSKGAAMLLAHEPDFADTSAASGRFDLQISGHSHGGQVVIPLVGAPQLPELGQKYPSGLYRVGDMIQYTNRGVGMVRPHVRFNCRPEITVFTLQAGSMA